MIWWRSASIHRRFQTWVEVCFVVVGPEREVFRWHWEGDSQHVPGRVLHVPRPLSVVQVSACVCHCRLTGRLFRVVCLTMYSSVLSPHATVSVFWTYSHSYTIRHLQNTAARLVLNMPYSSCSQPLLRELHWLPVESRVKIKLCVLMCQVSHGTMPHYLYTNCASHVLTIQYAPNQEAPSLLHGVDSDLLTKRLPSQRQLLGTLSTYWHSWLYTVSQKKTVPLLVLL